MVEVRRVIELLGAAIATALIQHFTLAAPQAERADANRIANFEARDQLAVCLQALHRELEASP